MPMETNDRGRIYPWRAILTFFLPSTLGVFLFMVPLKVNGAYTIPIVAFANSLQLSLSHSVTTLSTIIVTAMALMSLGALVIHENILQKHPFLFRLLNMQSIRVRPVWILVRVVGMAFILMVYFKVGPQMVRAENTGALVLNELMPVLFTVFMLAGFLLPLLLNYGLLEFLGTLTARIMRPAFGLPGCSAVNCLVSWIGDGSVGILITKKQFQEKHYTQKEALIIGTTFSSVSIAFCLVVISQVGLAHLFIQYYLTVCVAGLIAALIVPRLPPLCFKPDQYIQGQIGRSISESEQPRNHQYLLRTSLNLALDKANQAPKMSETLAAGLKNAVEMVATVLPVVMAIGTSALILAEYTPIFAWLGLPFVPILELLQIPEAQQAAQTLVVGFADMFIPSILAAGCIESEMTRFVVAAISVTQLIFMSEVGALLLCSNLPINIFELFTIFLQRTLVTLPVIAFIAHGLF